MAALRNGDRGVEDDDEDDARALAAAEIPGGPDVMNNKLWHIVDVRDVADALLLLYEKPESSGRYICSSDHICTRDLVNLLKMYPNIPDVEHKASLTSQKLMSLGWAPRRLEETLSDSVDCYENAGILKILDGHPCRLPHLFRASKSGNIINEGSSCSDDFHGIQYQGLLTRAASPRTQVA
ncbi:Os09g0491868 [Oryza sativa Japonica Group]|uniref:Os09g0491868 protein n=1 Tax=Oryza sativa subsp. japonica TaxID=39947 RepID=A0A0P0XNV1_ORYSJ|nr:hypothetical protein EE612_048682 [Oryza sativa]BAT08756.1 Os09g0491868 [Oryza sativa Japonica Group]